MKLILGSDKTGYQLREAIYAALNESGYDITVLGPKNEDEAALFYEVAPMAAKLIQNGEAELAILCCGTGMGMAQVAGKFKGIRAACTESVYSAKMARVINDSNILCMGGWIIAPVLGVEMANAFLNAGFVEGIEEWRKERLTKARDDIASLENEIYS